MEDTRFPLSKKNFIVIIVGVVMIISGLLVMTGEEFIDAREFSRALYISPVLMVLGFAVVAVGIVLKGEQPEEENTTLTTDDNNI